MKKLYPLIIVLYCFSGNNKLFAQTCSVTISTNPNTTQLNCAVTRITLKANPTGSGTITYLWSTGATTASINVKDSGIYTVTIKNAQPCTSSSSIHITKDITNPTVSILAFPDTICRGSTATLVGIGAVTYQWSPGSLTGTTVTVSPAATQLYTVTGTASNGCKGQSTFKLVVNPLPVAAISGNASVCKDAAEPFITFTGSKGTKPYTFTYNINNGPTETITTSGNNTSVTAGVSTGTTGSFSYNLISVTDANGCTHAQSGTASVTVLPAPALTSSTDTSICNNIAFNYTATSSAAGTNFSWRRPVVAGISNAAGSGTTASINETLHNTTAQPVVVNYIITLSTGTGCVITEILNVTVNPTPVINRISDTTFCNGTFVSGGIPFSSSSPNASFTWTNSNTNIGLAASGSGNIPPFIATNTSASNSISSLITVKITASSDNCAGRDTTFTIKVRPAPVLTSSKTASICDSTRFTYTAKSSATRTNFSWTRDVVPGISNKSAKGADSTINEWLDNITDTPVVVKYIFTLSPGNDTGCNNIETLFVTVNPTPKIKPITGYTFCNGVLATIDSFKSSSPNVSFTWYNNNTEIGLIDSGNGNILPFIATDTTTDAVAGHVTVKIIASSDNCPGPDSKFTITVQPAAVLTSAKTASICNKGEFNYTALSSATGTSFGWVRLADRHISPAPSLNINKTNLVQEKLINDTTQPVVVYYIFTLSTGKGCVTTDTLKLTVNPTPIIDPITGYTFCNGVLATIDSFKSSSPNASFTWYNNNTKIGLIDSGNGNILPFIATDTTTDAITGHVTVKITASSDNCPGPDTKFTVTVQPAAVLTSAKTASICNKGEFNYTLSSSATGTSFGWVRLADQHISPAPSLDTNKTSLIQEKLINDTTQPVVVYYIFTLSTGNGCITIDTLKLTVNPTPVIDSITGYTFCNGVLATIDSFKSSSPNASFTWYNDNTKIGLIDSGNGNILPFIATDTTADAITGHVTVKITASSDNCPGPDTKFTVTVQPAAVLTSAKTASICNKGEFNYTLSSSATGTSFGWVRLADRHISPAPSLDTNKTGLIQEKLINDTTQPVVVYYIFTLSTGNGCVTIDTLKLTVNPTPVINPIFDTAFCNGTFVSNGIPIKSKTQDASITWRVTNNVSIGLPSNGTGSIPRFFATNTTDTSVIANLTANIAVGDSNKCKGDAKTFTITVYPTARLIGTRDTSVCDSTTFNYTAISSAANTTFSWRRDFVKGVSNTADSMITDSINEILHNITDTPVVVKYLFTLTNGNNCNADDSIYVTVNPTPKILSITTGSPYCNSSSINGIALTSASPESTIKWTSDTTIGFGTNGIDSIHAFTATNTGTKPLTATINATITASNDHCPGPDTTFKITVLPTPHLLSTTDTSVCNNFQFKDSVISSAVNTIFSWRRDSVTGISNAADSGTSASINDTLINTTSQSVDVKYMIHLSTDTTSNEVGCNTVNILTVKVNPTPITDFIPDKIFCNTELVTGIQFTSKTDEASFTWSNSNNKIGLADTGVGNIPGFIATNTTLDTIMSKVKVSITTNDHCPGPDTTFTITVNPSAAKPYFTSLVPYSDALGLCSGSNNISFNVIAPVTGTDYKWSSDTITGTIITDSNIVHIKSTNYANTVISFLQPGNYSIKVKATNSAHGGCSDTSISQIVKVTNTDGIREQTIFEKGHLLIYPDNSLDPLTGYQWGYDSVISLADKNFGPPVPIQGQVYQFFIPDTRFINGQGDLDTTKYLYWVELRKGDCYSKVYYKGPYVGNNLEVVPPSATPRLQVIPNPNNGMFEIILSGNIYGDIQAKIFNVTGQAVYMKRFSKFTPYATEKFMTGNLASGLYFIELYSSDLKKVVSRFIIQH